MNGDQNMSPMAADEPREEGCEVEQVEASDEDHCGNYGIADELHVL